MFEVPKMYSGGVQLAAAGFGCDGESNQTRHSRCYQPVKQVLVLILFPPFLFTSLFHYPSILYYLRNEIQRLKASAPPYSSSYSWRPFYKRVAQACANENITYGSKKIELVLTRTVSNGKRSAIIHFQSSYQDSYGDW